MSDERKLDNDLDAISAKLVSDLEEAQKEGKNVPESIWAPGIPDNIKETDKVSNADLLSMAVDYLMVNVVLKAGFKVEPGFPRAEYHNILMKKDGIKYSIIVAPSIYPKYVTIDDESRLNVVRLSNQNNIITFFAPVGYRSVDPERAKAELLLKGDVYLTTFPGFIQLTDEPHQSLSVKDAKFYRPL